MHKTKKKQIEAMFAEAEGDFSTLVVRRGGNARQREVFVDGKIRLNWRADGTSQPIEVPQGSHRLHCVAIGDPGDTYGFALQSPHEEDLGADTLTELGGDAFDREVEIP
jgi:hypothetical protein